MITLDQTREVPFTGDTVDYGIAHLHEGGYAGLEMSLSWDQSSTASITYWCEWASLHDFILSFMGDTQVGVDGSGNVRYERAQPHRMNISGGFFLWASKVARIVGIPGQGEDDDGNLVNYPTYTDAAGLVYRYAAVTIQYEPVPYQILNDAEVAYNEEWKRYTSIQKTPRLDFLQVPAGGFFWIPESGEDKKSLAHNTPIREQSVDYIVTHHRLPEPFFNPADYVGYVNSDSGFLDGNQQVPSGGFDAETMLLLGMQEVIKPIGWRDILYYDYIYFFQYRPNTHNKSRRFDSKPDKWDYRQFSLDGATPTTNKTRVFKTVDMSLLFQPN